MVRMIEDERPVWEGFEQLKNMNCFRFLKGSRRLLNETRCQVMLVLCEEMGMAWAGETKKGS